MNVKRKYQSKSPEDRDFALRQVEDVISLGLVYFENKDKKDLIDDINGLMKNFDLATLREVFTHCATVAATQGVLASGPAKSPVDPRLPLLPDGRPALWAERTTGREVSPADFIKAHYGHMRDDGTWDSDGLTRNILRRLDRPLYLALSKLFSRLHKEGKSVPDDLLVLLEKPSERLDAELLEANLADPAEAYAKFPDDYDKANRLYAAARRREGRSITPS